ncbi:MAG: hypothetical protein B7X08_01960 [Acidocella sp. 20-63-7]|nr:MAG: hypothetical protein B7X08_01960 [Acidocella sp. 20-63-7]HQT46152.1 SCO family protein [Acidocella sp.]
MKRPRRAAAGLVLAFLALQPPAARATPPGFGGPFTLIDGAAGGRTVTEQTYRGKFLLLFFGYTNCPDVCPATLYKLAQTLKQLGSAAQNLQTLFITVDPARDTPAIISRYAALFSPAITGLSGTPAQIDRIEQEFHIYVGPTDPKTGAITHGTLLYFVAPDGTFLTAYPDTFSVKSLTAQLRARLSTH